MSSTTFDLEERMRRAFQRAKSRSVPSDGDELEAQVETVEGDEGEEKRARVTQKPIYINLFQHPDAHPVALDLALLLKYGPDWMTWETETLELRIPQDFRTNSISDLNMEKVQAVKTLHFVDSFWQEWEVFLWCTMPLNGFFSNFGHMQVPTVAQCLVSVDIANRIRTDVGWSQEVQEYLTTVWKFSNLFCSLPPVDFLKIDVPEVVDCEEVARRWPSVRSSGDWPSGGTIVGEQLRKMAVANDYLEESRARLREQMAVVNDV